MKREPHHLIEVGEVSERELLEKVKTWGREKGLNDPVMQFAKCCEENGEIAHELTRGRFDSPEIVDSIGDSFVTLIILADILGYDIFDCLSVAYKEIKDRSGKTINGSFIKDIDNNKE